MSRAEQLIDKLVEAKKPEVDYDKMVDAIEALGKKFGGHLEDVQGASTHGYGDDIEVVVIIGFSKEYALYKKGKELVVGTKDGKLVPGTPTWGTRAKKKASKWVADNDPVFKKIDKFMKQVKSLPALKGFVDSVMKQTFGNYEFMYSNSPGIEVLLKSVKGAA